MMYLFETLFESPRDTRATRLMRAWLAGLFVAGLVGWSYVMGWGATPLDFHDWTDINVPRLLFLQHALRTGEWPLHMSGTAALHGVTDRFLALPDVITTPQTLLLLVLPVQAFVLVDVWLWYGAGFYGLLLLRRRFDWSLLVFSGVSLLFLFNGHILSHYSVGHFTWASYFLFPFVCLSLLRFLDGDDSWRNAAMLSTVMFVMVLAGGQHHMTWVLLLLALMVPFSGARAWWLVAVAAAAGLLSAVRLLPPVLEVPSFRAAGLVSDVIGYPSVSHLIGALVVLRREMPSVNEAWPGNLAFFDRAYYEFNAYLGAVGFALVLFGMYRWVREDRPAYRWLPMPLLAMTALSLGSAYKIVRLTQVPLFEAERYTARMVSLPLTFCLVMAAIAIDRHLKQVANSAWQRALSAAAVLFVGIDIGASARLWRIGISSRLFGAGTFDPAGAGVAHRADPAYVSAILAGLAITVITAAGLAALVRREAVRGRQQGRGGDDGVRQQHGVDRQD